MSYALGTRAIRRLCSEQDPLAWQRAKLSSDLFKPYEKPVFEWVALHLQQHHVLPQVETLLKQFPDALPLETPEPSSYYLSLLENQFCYERINKANIDSQEVLKHDQNAHDVALKVLLKAAKEIQAQKYRLRILDVAKEAPELILATYHKTQLKDDQIAMFGWPYMDQQFGGVMAGDVVSFVGRPAAGKTWQMLWSAINNWRLKKTNVMFVSMEMTTLPIAQRIAAVYTGQPIQQLKVSGFSKQTMTKFCAGLQAMKEEDAKFYVVDGNLAANVDDLFLLSDMLECPLIFIDGAYLLRHSNPRLDRWTRAAENVELIKRHCTDLNMTSFCSWQFNREASKKQKKGGGETGDVEDIGYSDAIGQISTIVLGLFQEEGIETLKSRKVRVLKGRNGEIGQFSIEWEFDVMSFQQCDPPLTPASTNAELQWI